MAAPAPALEVPVQLVVVGASAGGVEALKLLVAALPATLACPVVIVLHLSAKGKSVLSDILGRAGPLPSRPIVDGEPAAAGLHVAPVDRHVLVTRTGLRLSTGPQEHGLRPAVDPTLRSAAEVYGAGAVGVVLSGTGRDGAAGLRAIHDAGGRSLVQQPTEARYAAMPEHAIATDHPDAVLPLEALAERMVGWCAAPRR